MSVAVDLNRNRHTVLTPLQHPPQMMTDLSMVNKQRKEGPTHSCTLCQEKRNPYCGPRS